MPPEEISKPATRPGQGLGDIRNGEAGERFLGNGSHGTGQVAFFLRTVTDDHGFVQGLIILFHNNGKRGVAGGHADRLVTDAGHFQHSTGIGLDRELSIQIGDGAVGRAFFHDPGSDDRIPGGVFHHTGHGPSLYLVQEPFAPGRPKKFT